MSHLKERSRHSQLGVFYYLYSYMGDFWQHISVHKDHLHVKNISKITTQILRGLCGLWIS